MPELREPTPKYPKDYTDAERAAIADQELVRAATTVAGGKVALQDLMQWTRDNLSTADRRAVQEELNSSDLKVVAGAIGGLRRRREIADSEDATAAIKAAGGFTTHAEYAEALAKEPRGNRSPQFVERVNKTPLSVINGQ